MEREREMVRENEERKIGKGREIKADDEREDRGKNRERKVGTETETLEITGGCEP